MTRNEQAEAVGDAIHELQKSTRANLSQLRDDTRQDMAETEHRLDNGIHELALTIRNASLWMQAPH